MTIIERALELMADIVLVGARRDFRTIEERHRGDRPNDCRGERDAETVQKTA